MPHTVPVSQVMISPKDWTLLRADTPVKDAIAILRIINEDHKLERGHSTPLVMDDSYTLIGLIRLTDLLRSVRPLCENPEEACKLDQALKPVSELVRPFPASVEPEESILDALDVMLDHDVSLLPVLKDGKLLGVVHLGAIFDTVAALMFDERATEERSWISKHLHLW